ncbi:MAG: HipA family kinase [Ktedonobacterales bacterium]
MAERVRPLRRVLATRYVTPLREGGSLPGLVEADDDGLYVLKFRGAGQGPKALVAEVSAGEIGRQLGLPVPELVLMDLDAALGRSEPDFEVYALIKASAGLNMGMDFLPGSLAFDPAAAARVDADLASRIVWFDALVTNVDRTPRNTNLLEWHRRLWLIDHGAALYFHHGGGDYPARAQAAFPRIAEHVQLPYASRLEAADDALRPLVPPDIVRNIVALVPDAWLTQPGAPTPERQRTAYIEYLTRRIAGSRTFVEEALGARAQLV